MKLILFFFSLISLSFSIEYNKKILRIYVIEINPILTSITNYNLYPNNNGHPYVSEYFSHSKERALNEMKQNIEYASHGKVMIEFVGHQILEEFPLYQQKVQLLNGQYDYRFDEETYISMSKMENDPYKGDWFQLYYHPKFKEMGDFQFNYDYIIERFDLDKLKKKNVFDHVWLLGIDPLSTYESIMVGSNPYWINGKANTRDCKNFMLLTVSFSRRDSNLHRLGHAFEDLINYPFTGTFSNFDKDYNDKTEENYEKLNEWDKFTLINMRSKGENAGVGIVHFPFNGVEDYDYDNKEMVYSNWEYWANYPNIKGEKKKYNSQVWMNLTDNDYIKMDPQQNRNMDRLYIRFWMSMFPHIDGYTKTGQLNNWWDYYTNCDYVLNLRADNNVVTGSVGYEVPLNYNVYYNSGEVENIRYVTRGDNIQINGNCVDFKNDKLIGIKRESRTLTIYRDSKSLTFIININ